MKEESMTIPVIVTILTTVSTAILSIHLWHILKIFYDSHI
jgi:hypothetical protein